MTIIHAELLHGRKLITDKILRIRCEFVSLSLMLSDSTANKLLIMLSNLQINHSAVSVIRIDQLSGES